MTICDIATALHSARPTISNTIAHFTQEGFLIESGDDRDRRLRYQRLSELGTEVDDDFLTKVRAHEIRW